MGTALKVMPPILLLCWPTLSGAVVGGMAVEAEPSHQYSLTCYCHVRDGSRGAVWQNDIWHRSADEAKVCHWIPPSGKKRPPLTLDERFWRPNSGCELSEAVGGAFQHWWQQQWSPPQVEILTSAACRLVFLTGGNGWLMVMTVEKYCFVAENCFYQILLFCSLYLL